MKMKVRDRNYTDPKLIMKTSVRGRCYSIRFENLNGGDVCCWAHLNNSQALKMINDLESFLEGAGWGHIVRYNK